LISKLVHHVCGSSRVFAADAVFDAAGPQAF
jgi:hypothetical protein